MGDTVLYERKGSVGFITLNRPQVLNAINDQWIEDFLAVAQEARGDTEARVIVVRGVGRSFCAGADLKEAGKQYESLQEYRDTHMTPEQDIARVFHRMGKPVIGQIHGYAVGGGCEVAMLCDIRIAEEGARFGFPEVRVGATVTLAGLYHLPRIVGLGRAFELLYSTDMIDAREAHRIGLVNKVVPRERLEETVMAMAESIAAHYPLELSLTRNSVYRALDSDFDAGVEEENEASVIPHAAGSRAVGMKEAMEQIQRRKGKA